MNVLCDKRFPWRIPILSASLPQGKRGADGMAGRGGGVAAGGSCLPLMESA